MLIRVDGEYAHGFAQIAGGPYDTKKEAMTREEALEKKVSARSSAESKTTAQINKYKTSANEAPVTKVEVQTRRPLERRTGIHPPWLHDRIRWTCGRSCKSCL